jgi:hypothetical protein
MVAGAAHRARIACLATEKDTSEGRALEADEEVIEFDRNGSTEEIKTT